MRSFFRKARKEPVEVTRGHLAYVREDGAVLDLGKVTDEDMRLLNALCESAYRHRGTRSGRRGISETTLIRLRGMVKQWYGVFTQTK